jgi:peptidoglycan/LPS O-acetylase OafA/YrhL
VAAWTCEANSAFWRSKKEPDIPSTDRQAAASAKTSALGYQPALDGLRAVAILAVLGFHVIHSFYPRGRYPFSGGYLGVDIFFVLSGFLISSVLLADHANSGISLKAFYIRRVRRLVPAQATMLIAFLAAATLASFFAPSALELQEAVAATLAVVFNFANWVIAFRAFDLGPLGPMWSLSIEEQFYLIWPVVLVLLLRRRVSRELMLSIVLVAAAASATWRAILFAVTDSVDRTYYGLDTHADLLLLGAGLALAMSTGVRAAIERRPGPLALVAALSILLLFAATGLTFYGDPLMFYGGYAIVGIATSCIIAHLVLGRPDNISRCLSARWLRWIGQRSYAMYLWHYLVLYVEIKSGVIERIGLGRFPTSVLTLLVVAGVTIGIAAVSYTFIEQKFLGKSRSHVVRQRPVSGDPSRDVDLTQAK